MTWEDITEVQDIVWTHDPRETGTETGTETETVTHTLAWVPSGCECVSVHLPALVGDLLGGVFHVPACQQVNGHRAPILTVRGQRGLDGKT